MHCFIVRVATKWACGFTKSVNIGENISDNEAVILWNLFPILLDCLLRTAAKESGYLSSQAWQNVFTSMTRCWNATRGASFTMNMTEANTMHSLIEIIALAFLFCYNRNIMVVLGVLAKWQSCSIWCAPCSKQCRLAHLEKTGGRKTFVCRTVLLILIYY